MLPESSSTPRRKPQQQRGEQRVSAMLDAAAGVFAEAGFDAATMTAIAERSSSSIGALYQYYPNKLTLALALRERYAEELVRRWDSVMADAPRLELPALVEHIFGLMIGFFNDYPAYLTLLNATLAYQRSEDARQRLRAQFGAALRARQPALAEAEAVRVANVALQMAKGLNPLYEQADTAGRSALVAEFKLAMVAYLQTRLRG